MPEKKKVVVVISAGMDDERASVGWSVANGGISTGLEVTVFLVSAGVDWARKGAADKAHLNPFDPTMGEMIKNFTSRGGAVLCCPPCAKVRGYEQDDFFEGVVITGSGAVHELIKQGAATLSF